MKKLTGIILLILSMTVLLAGCRKKNEQPQFEPLPVETTAITQLEPSPTMAPTPKISEKYNSITDADKTETDQVRKELLQVANGCMDIYQAADKGSAINVVLSEATVRDMLDRIGQMGYPAVDAFGKMDMRCPEPIVQFGNSIPGYENISVTYFTVYNDGQISAYHIGRQSGMWYLIAMSAEWSKQGTPSVVSEGRYVIGDVQFSDKGWLIYNRDTASFDDNQRSNINSYVFVRVLPYDSTKRALCEKYILPIGYFENNLFTTTWSEADFGPIDFNSLYSSIFGMYMGTEDLAAYNAAQYFDNVDGTSLFLIPTENFERMVRHYFNIDPSVLKNISDYSYALDGYFFYGYREGIYNVTPRISEPEVVDYWYNSDGTLTMQVDAVNKWYGTDRAFSHQLTVRETGNGFQYVSNLLFADENSIIPQSNLSYLLNVERAKTPY